MEWEEREGRILLISVFILTVDSHAKYFPNPAKLANLAEIFKCLLLGWLVVMVGEKVALTTLFIPIWAVTSIPSFIDIGQQFKVL